MARLAAIDIGSNALRLRIVDVDPPETGPKGPRFKPFREVFADRAPVRLGHDVFTKGRLEPSMIAAACEALRRFRLAMDDAKVDRYRAVATSASREAKNRDVFVERAEREAGVHVEVIEGVEEARLVQVAVDERMNLVGRSVVLVDIGGGSTELTLMRDRHAIYSRSLPVGTVRLIEAFLDGDGRVDDEGGHLLDEYVRRVSSEALRDIMEAAGGKPDGLVGTGGNIETLAELCPPSRAFAESRGIDVEAMRLLLRELYATSMAERQARWGLRADRADTLVPATKILTTVALGLDIDRIEAPGVGLKEGVLVDLATEHFLPRDFSGEAAAVSEACLRLGRRYKFDERHGQVVASLAARLFDDLAPYHGQGPRERILLMAAALLHDVGDFVRYEGHHKHGHYIILHSDLMGLSPAERDIVANVARYHRKSPPSLEHENFRALSQKSRSQVKVLAGLLRVADALDREHRSVVTSVRARVDAGAIWLDIQGSTDRVLEEWTVRAKSGLLRESLGLEVRISDPVASALPAPPPSQRP